MKTTPVSQEFTLMICLCSENSFSNFENLSFESLGISGQASNAPRQFHSCFPRIFSENSVDDQIQTLRLHSMPKLDNCIYFKAKAIFCIVWQMSYALWRNQWEISGILHVNSKARKWRHESDKTQTNKPEWETIFLKHFLKQPVFLKHIFEPRNLPRFPLVLLDRAGVEWASSGISSFAFYFQTSRASLFQTAGYLVFLKPYPVHSVLKCMNTWRCFPRRASS